MARTRSPTSSKDFLVVRLGSGKDGRSHMPVSPMAKLLVRVASYPGQLGRNLRQRTKDRRHSYLDHSMLAGIQKALPTINVDGTSSRLPLELYDKILENLSTDLHALSACSLTCRAWVSIVRYYRFRQVSLVPSNLDSFRDLVQAHAEPANYVRTLSIDYTKKPGQSVLWQVQHVAVLSDIFDVLKFVETLCLNSLLITPSVLLALSKLHTVKELEINEPHLRA